LVIVCGVFIHPQAEDDKKIYQFNYQATKMAIANAMSGRPTVEEILAGKDQAAHPFRGF
jgi:5,6,7,8-tetrahydromethanopterin hydro-lyase